MIEKRNAYEIIGTNRDYIIRIHGEANKDKFILEKKNDTIRRLKNEYDLLIEQFNQTKDEKTKIDLQKRIKKLKDEEIPLVESAYLEICDEASRQVYDDQLNLTIRIEGTKAKVDRKITENAYEILGMSKTSCDDKTSNSRIIDRNLFRMKNALIKQSEDEIKELQKKLDSLDGRKDPESYREKSGIDGKIAMLEQEIERVKKAYDKVATREARKNYEPELSQIEEQANERIRQSELRKKYKISQYYNPSSIQQVGYKSLEITEKERIKQEKEKKRNLSVVLVREDGTAVTVERIGMLGYKTSNRMTGMLDAYRITRTVNGEKKWDVRYTNLNMIDLSRNPKTGELQNKEYHDFVANVFLSEDSIEGTGYNAGYLGQALKDKDGNYVHDLKNVEELSAVMKFDEIKKDKEKKGEESKEGEAYEQ